MHVSHFKIIKYHLRTVTENVYEPCNNTIINANIVSVNISIKVYIGELSYVFYMWITAKCWNYAIHFSWDPAIFIIMHPQLKNVFLVVYFHFSAK